MATDHLYQNHPGWGRFLNLLHRLLEMLIPGSQSRPTKSNILGMGPRKRHFNPASLPQSETEICRSLRAPVLEDGMVPLSTPHQPPTMTQGPTYCMSVPCCAQWRTQIHRCACGGVWRTEWAAHRGVQLCGRMAPPMEKPYEWASRRGSSSWCSPGRHAAKLNEPWQVPSRGLAFSRRSISALLNEHPSGPTSPLSILSPSCQIS